MVSKIESLQQQLDSLGLEPVIGLETHVTVTSTKTKLFCACKNQEGAMPNTDICPICTGQMGVLPLPNKEVVKEGVKLALAIQADIAKVIAFDRKHYYYPDLPKGFQITQYANPIALKGKVECYREDGSKFSVHLDHFHIEEDPAKLIHTKNGTLIDYNRSGKPLLEIVTKPDIYSIADAISYMNALHKLVRALHISDADMEKGQFKSDISISLRKKGDQKLNPRTEIKNMNSFKFSQEAIIQEVEKQLKYWMETGEPKRDQLTVKWNEEKGKIEVMRKKENVADYRIMPEPDIPYISLDGIEKDIVISRDILPFEIEKKLIENTNLTIKEVQFFSENVQRASLLFQVDKKVGNLQDLARLFLNILPEEAYTKLSVDILGEVIVEMQKRKNTSITISKHIIQELLLNPVFDFRGYLDSLIIEDDVLEDYVDKVIHNDSFQSIIRDIQAGNDKAAGALVGKVKALIDRQVDGAKIREKILQKIQNNQSTTTLGSQDKTITEASYAEKQEQNTEKSFSIEEYYIADSYRSHQIKDIDESYCGKVISLVGWIQSIRDHGDLVFVDLREDGELFQIKFSKETFLSIDTISALTNESVILCRGPVVKRDESDINTKIRSGSIELDCRDVKLLSKAAALPFEISHSHKVNESKRMQYRYLDLRNTKVRENIYKRHEVIKMMRNYLNERGFIEVETPIIGKASDEGSREFIVPSRLYPGQFYVLPQAPQQLKQLLMGSGIDKYYQLARCFRDEDPKGDRQPEFTQLDMELAFTDREEIINLISGILLQVAQTLYPSMRIQNMNFPRIDYVDSMEWYGCDKPDIRYGLKMRTITSLLQNTDFSIFRQVIDAGGVVKALRVEKEIAEKFGKKYLDEKLRSFSIEWGLGGLANIRIGDQNFITDKLGDQTVEAIIQSTGSEEGDILLFGAGEEKVVNKALDAVRQKIAKDFSLYDENELAFCWVVNFPMFEKTDEGNRKFTHNPFSLPKKEYISDLLQQKNIEHIIAQQYDIVLNGHEIGGGSIRAHIPEILEGTYRVMGYNDEEIEKSVGHMLKAFRYGFPPHGGIALGVDRLIMILQQKKTIREVIAFPKTGDGKDLLMNSPSYISEEKQKEANIKVL